MAIANGAIGAVARRGAAILAALAMCACAGHDKPKPVEENAYPEDYRTQVANLARRQFGGKIADAYIADPVLKTSMPTPRFVACMRFAADGGGSSKGNKLYAAYFYAGKITQIVEATAVEQCDKAAFLPFAELR